MLVVTKKKRKKSCSFMSCNYILFIICWQFYDRIYHAESFSYWCYFWFSNVFLTNLNILPLLNYLCCHHEPFNNWSWRVSVAGNCDGKTTLSCIITSLLWWLIIPLCSLNISLLNLCIYRSFSLTLRIQHL